MENSFSTIHLQQAWLQEQQNKWASSSTIASLGDSISTQTHKGTSFATEMGLYGRNLAPGSDSACKFGSGLLNLQAFQTVPSIHGSGGWNSHEAANSFHLVMDDWVALDPAASADNFFDSSNIEEETLMDPAVQYMNDMLMEEGMEEQNCMLQDCTAYYAMAKGFYEILGEDISSLTTLSTSLNASDSPLSDDDNWKDEALNVERQAVADMQIPQNGSLFSPQRFLDFSDRGSGSDRKLLASQWSEIGLHDAPTKDFGLQERFFGNAFELNENERGQAGCLLDPVLPELSVQEESNTSFLDGNQYENVNLQSSGLPESLEQNFGAQDAIFVNVPGSNDVVYGSEPSTGLSHPSLDRIVFQDVQDRVQNNGMNDAVILDFKKNLRHVQNNLHLWLHNNRDESTDSSKAHTISRLFQTSLQSYLQGSVEISKNGDLASATVEKQYLENVEESQKVENHHRNKGKENPFLQVPNVPVKPPSPCLSSTQDTISFVQNENLNAEMLAERLYREGPLPFVEKGDHKPQLRKHNSRATRIECMQTGEPVTSRVDLKSLLVSCAQAIAVENLRKANEILQEIRRHSSPYGDGPERLAHYFAEALVARLSGAGPRLYTAFATNRPSAADLLKAYRVAAGTSPFYKIGHYFANKCILKAAEGVSRLHIIDYGIAYGFQWPCLISALSERKVGLSCLRITGIDFPQPGMKPAERVEGTGRRLAEYAKTYGVPFEYHAIVDNWEDIQLSALNLREDELLAVNCVNRLRQLIDESVIVPSPRKMVLGRIRSMKPAIFVEGVVNASFSAPFFVTRFREALLYYSSKFDMMDTHLENDNAQRWLIEKEAYGRDIINIVACEGTERIERPETYRQWQARTQRAGFELLPLEPTVMSKSQAAVKKVYHKDYSVDEDGGWMLLSWKGRIIHAYSSWKTASLSSSSQGKGSKRFLINSEGGA